MNIGVPGVTWFFWSSWKRAHCLVTFEQLPGPSSFVCFETSKNDHLLWNLIIPISEWAQIVFTGIIFGDIYGLQSHCDFLFFACNHSNDQCGTSLTSSWLTKLLMCQNVTQWQSLICGILILAGPKFEYEPRDNNSMRAKKYEIYTHPRLWLSVETWCY